MHIFVARRMNLALSMSRSSAVFSLRFNAQTRCGSLWRPCGYSTRGMPARRIPLRPGAPAPAGAPVRVTRQLSTQLTHLSGMGQPAADAGSRGNRTKFHNHALSHVSSAPATPDHTRHHTCSHHSHTLDSCSSHTSNGFSGASLPTCA